MVSGSTPLDEGTLSNSQLRHIRQMLLAYLANQRVGTARTKTRAEVAGASRKLYKQKGTGRARAGNRRTPVRVGGGHAFAKRPREWRQYSPRKMRQGAIQLVIGQHLALGRVTRAELLSRGTPSTRALLAWIHGLGVSGRVLILTSENRPDLVAAARNCREITVAEYRNVNIYQVATVDRIIADSQLAGFGAKAGVQ